MEPPGVAPGRRQQEDGDYHTAVQLARSELSHLAGGSAEDGQHHHDHGQGYFHAGNMDASSVEPPPVQATRFKPIAPPPSAGAGQPYSAPPPRAETPQQQPRARQSTSTNQYAKQPPHNGGTQPPQQQVYGQPHQSYAQPQLDPRNPSFVNQSFNVLSPMQVGNYSMGFPAPFVPPTGVSVMPGSGVAAPQYDFRDSVHAGMMMGHQSMNVGMVPPVTPMVYTPSVSQHSPTIRIHPRSSGSAQIVRTPHQAKTRSQAYCAGGFFGLLILLCLVIMLGFTIPNEMSERSGKYTEPGWSMITSSVCYIAGIILGFVGVTTAVRRTMRWVRLTFIAMIFTEILFAIQSVALAVHTVMTYEETMQEHGCEGAFYTDLSAVQWTQEQCAQFLAEVRMVQAWWPVHLLFLCCLTPCVIVLRRVARQTHDGEVFNRNRGDEMTGMVEMNETPNSFGSPPYAGGILDGPHSGVGGFDTFVNNERILREAQLDPTHFLDNAGSAVPTGSLAADAYDERYNTPLESSTSVDVNDIAAVLNEEGAIPRRLG